jgi:flavin-dependent dehydrogenase
MESDRIRDAVVVGGGPAGLAFAAAAAARGLDVLVLEARPFPVDKACGEGILPAGHRALASLGILDGLGPADATPLRAIRWVDALGPEVEVPLPTPGGLGVRRLALSAALLARAGAAGAEIRQSAVTGHRREPDSVAVETGQETVRGRLLVAADGLASPVRHREGLDLQAGRRRRFGVRRHVACASGGSAVEVHLADGVEGYVTPAGDGRVGIAFLFEGRAPGGWDALLGRFPRLTERFSRAAPLSEERGAGPFEQASRARVLDRLVLLGDAAGFVDAVTGDGTSLALCGAIDLAALAPEAIARGAGRATLLPYERAWRERYRRYALFTRALLAISRRPALRRRLIALAARAAGPLEWLVAAALAGGGPPLPTSPSARSGGRPSGA